MSSSRLIYGFHAITAKLRHDPDSIREIMVDPTRQDARARDLLGLHRLRCDGLSRLFGLYRLLTVRLWGQSRHGDPFL
mgnify:CR=1 FL=1